MGRGGGVAERKVGEVFRRPEGCEHVCRPQKVTGVEFTRARRLTRP